jgi:hypothetical protein
VKPADPIQVRHDPLVLTAKRPAQVQILLARASERDTRVELKADSAALSIPRAIVIPAGHVMTGIRLTVGDVPRDRAVTISAAATDSAGKSIVSRTAIPIQANSNDASTE